MRLLNDRYEAQQQQQQIMQQLLQSMDARIQALQAELVAANGRADRAEAERADVLRLAVQWRKFTSETEWMCTGPFEDQQGDILGRNARMCLNVRGLTTVTYSR